MRWRKSIESRLPECNTVCGLNKTRDWLGEIVSSLDSQLDGSGSTEGRRTGYRVVSDRLVMLADFREVASAEPLPNNTKWASKAAEKVLNQLVMPNCFAMLNRVAMLNQVAMLNCFAALMATDSVPLELCHRRTFRL